MSCNCQSNHKGNLILGIFAGAAIGAAIGMLFTPHKGTTMRRIIRKKGENIADDVIETIEDRVGQFSDTVTEKLETLKSDLMSRFA